MPLDQTLTKVAADLAAGRTTLARQRLRGLVASFPDRLDLREQLADTYRRDGDLAQAGRWSHLSPERDERELIAFRRTYRDPFARMEALAWRTEEDSAGPRAGARLRALREEAEQIAGAPVSWQHPHRPHAPSTWSSRIVGWLGVTLVVTLFALVLVGLGWLAVTGVKTAWSWVA
ncbi:DUF6584 family protein [Kineococcus indalonis]|uniref:DUF6584 family protein n=1 Tax=Kineococcus indalonis TaxID=2696566 RepID=UPI0014133A4B|nr:DUF6584 family protein [Kineococcus indalonis]NAZ84984.1 hypothetical protein [Kineococcus indalonis]